MTQKNSPTHTTLLLAGAQGGDEKARQELFDRLYSELQELARQQLRRRRGESFQTTELVHEAYVKLSQAKRLAAADRSHFFAIAATAMRQILVDHFRRLSSLKRGALRLETLDEAELEADDGATVLAIDEALGRFAELDERAAKVIELKFFGGMNENEIASTLEVSIRTVSGDWRRARAWLHRELAAV